MVYSTGKNNYYDHNKWMACTASEEVYRIVGSSPKGYVHSIFNTSFNLAFGERLVHVGGLENGLSPFGIALNQHDVHQLIRRINNQQDVAWDSSLNAFIFSEGTSLSLEQAERTSHSLKADTYNKQHLINNFVFIAERLAQQDWRMGLAETIEDSEMMIDYLLGRNVSQKNVPLLEELDTLKKLAHGDQTVDAEKVFNYWIGRGMGLTPSGDDIITGICAIYSVIKGTNGAFRQQLKSYLLENGRDRTTHVALEYLLYAAENKFHSHLIHMCHMIDQPRGPEFVTALEEMKEIGHTSGADTLFGILLGIKASAI